MKHVFIVGSKGVPANYGGFETFVDELVSRKKSKSIKYHVACLNSENNIDYKGADCFTVTVPNVGPAKAVLYDLKAIKQITRRAERENINNGVLYVLACRIGPFFKHATKKPANVVSKSTLTRMGMNGCAPNGTLLSKNIGNYPKN